MKKIFQSFNLKVIAMFMLILFAGNSASWGQSITVTSSPLPVFHLYTGTGASYAQTFIFVGAALGAANTQVVATAPPNFEVSKDNSTWGATATYACALSIGAASGAGGASTLGSPTVTMTSTTGIVAGYGISQANLPAGTTVLAVVNGTTLTLSANATATGITLTFVCGPLCYTRVKTGLAVQNFGTLSLAGGSTTSASTTITCTSTAGVLVGENITGTGIPANTTVTSVVNGTTLTISNAASATGGPALTFTVSPNVILASNGATVAKTNCAVSMQVYPATTSFTSGNVTALRYGYTTSIGQLILIDEYTPAGTYIQTYITPASKLVTYSPNGTSAVGSGSAANDGGLSLSADGQYLVYGGYDGYLGTIGIANTTSASNPRAGILLKGNGTFTLGTTTSQFSAASVRGNAAIDGSNIWFGGNGGIFTVPTGTTSSAGTQIIIGNLRGATIHNGQLYAGLSASANFVGTTGTTIVPNAASTANVIASGLTNVYTMLALDRDPNVPGNDLIYIADGTNGILKYSFDGTTWTARGSLTGVCQGVAGFYNGSGVQLYLSVGLGGGNTLYKFLDLAAYNATITSSATAITISGTLMTTAFANTVFRGIALAPVTLASTPNVAVSMPVATPNNILLGSTNNVIYQMNLTAGTAQAVLTGLTITTAGTYVATDFAATGFKIWISSNSTFNATAIPLGSFAPGASGSTITTSNLAQLIPASSTRYFYFTADVVAGATVGNTINITATPLSNILLADAGTKSGSAGVGGVKTISPAPSISCAPTTLPILFTYFGTASGAQSYSLTGSYLTTNLDVTAPSTNFQVSSNGTNFFPSLSLVPSGGSVSATIYVRLTTVAPVGTYTGQLITNASTGATTQNVTISGTVSTAPVSFTAGNIVVYRVGNGAVLGSSATDTYLDEYSVAANAPLVQSVALPTGINGSNRMLTNSGSATSEGTLNRTVDGQYLIVGGYDAAVGTSAIVSTSAATNNRVVGLIGANGNVNTSTRIPDGFSTNNIRSATSIDGTSFWATGAPGAGNDGGVRYITLGSNTSTQLSTAPTNARVITIFNSQLYITGAASPNIGFNKVGSGVSNSLAQIVTQQTLPSNPTDAYGFVFLDRDATIPGADVLYIANNAGGLLKYSFDGTTWTARGSLTGQVTALTGVVNGANADLYVLVGTSSPSSLYKITDAALYNANITGSAGAVSSVAGAVLIKTSPTNTIYKGVAFAPVQLPGTPQVSLSAGAPAAGPVLQATQGNVIYKLTATVTTAQAVLTNLTLTTGGTYITSDLVANTLKLYCSTDNIFDASDVLIGTTAIVGSGSTISFDVAQVLPVGTRTFFLTTDIQGSATIGNTINITSTPLSNISFANGAIKSGSANAGGVQTIFSSTIPTVFYSNGSNLDDISNWGDNTDGSVSILAYAPTNFTTPGTTFIVSNGSTTLTNNWIVSGANTKVVVASGQSFTIPVAYSLTTSAGTVIDVQAGGTLNILNSTIPSFGTLDVASTEIFGGPSTQTIPGSLVFSYGNLTLTGSGTKDLAGVFNSAPIEVKGDLLINGATLDRSLVTEQTIGFWGDFTIINGVTYTSGYNNNVNLEAKGTANQVIYGNGFPVNCKKFYLNINNISGNTNIKSGGSLTLSSSGGGTNLFLSNALKFNCGSAAPLNSATFVDNGQSITIGGDLEITGTNANYTLTGSIILNGATGTVNIRQDGSATGNTIIKANLHNLSIQTTGNTVTQVQPATGNLTLNILGSFTIGGTSTGKFSPNGNTIKVGGNFTDTRTIDMIAASTSTFEFNGTSAQTFSTAYTSGESFFNIKINNAAGVIISGTGIMKNTSTGNMNCAVGILNTGSGKVILNNTATITEPANGSSFVQGRVETQRTFSSLETFGGLGIDVTGSGTSITCARIIGTPSAIGCASSSTIRYFDFTPSIAGATAVVYHYFDTNYEMNNFDEGEISIFQSASPFTTWTVSAATIDSNLNKVTLTTPISTLARITLSVNAPTGGNAIPAGSNAISRAALICPNTSTTITLSGFGIGTVQWQQSANGLTGWANVIGGSGATSLVYTTPLLNAATYYRAIVSNSCFDVSSTTALISIAAPISVTISSVTATSALVSWSPYAANSNANYTVTWSGSAGSGTQTNAINPKLITGLSGGLNLNVNVTQNTPAGCINTGSATTSTLCSAPTGLTLNPTSTSTIVASWSGGASPYKIFWRILDNNNPAFLSAVVTGTSYTITGLSAGLEYEVYVASFNCPVANSVGQASQYAFATTLGGSACTVPTISVASNCPSQITVTLSGSPTNQYFIYLKRITPVAGSIIGYNFTGTTFNYNVSTAFAGSVYEVFAESKCVGNVYSTECTPAFVTVKSQCPAISNLVLSNATCHGFTCSWNPDNCSGLGVSYYVFVRKVGASNFNGYPNITNFKMFDILMPNTTYEIFVRSSGCANSVGLASTTEQISTLVTCRDEDLTNSDANTEGNNNTESLSNELSIYPNPNSGMLNVDYLSSNTEFHTVKIEVFNLVGQTLLTNIVEINSGILNHPINLNKDCSSGIYFVRLTDGDSRIEKRFIVQH